MLRIEQRGGGVGDNTNGEWLGVGVGVGEYELWVNYCCVGFSCMYRYPQVQYHRKEWDMPCSVEAAA